MCGAEIMCMDNRRKYCDNCRKVRKKMFDVNAIHAFRLAAKTKRLKEQEELAGLRTENEILREEVIRLEGIINRMRGATL